MLHGTSHSIEDAQQRVVAERNHKPPTHTIPSLKQVVFNMRLINFNLETNIATQQCNICRKVFTNKCEKDGKRDSENAYGARKTPIQNPSLAAEERGKNTDPSMAAAAIDATMPCAPCPRTYVCSLPRPSGAHAWGWPSHLQLLPPPGDPMLGYVGPRLYWNKKYRTVIR
jgi:hypothetical protein